jgi:hypothetical protein
LKKPIPPLSTVFKEIKIPSNSSKKKKLELKPFISVKQIFEETERI